MKTWSRMIRHRARVQIRAQYVNKTKSKPHLHPVTHTGRPDEISSKRNDAPHYLVNSSSHDKT